MSDPAINNARQAADEATRASEIATQAATHAREAVAGAAHAADEKLGDLAMRVKERVGDMPGPGELRETIEGRVHEFQDARAKKKRGLRSRLARPALIVGILAVAFFVLKMMRSD